MKSKDQRAYEAFGKMVSHLRAAHKSIGLTLPQYARAVFTEATMAAVASGVNRDSFLAIAEQEYDLCEKAHQEQQEIEAHNDELKERRIIIP